MGRDKTPARVELPGKWTNIWHRRNAMRKPAAAKPENSRSQRLDTRVTPVQLSVKDSRAFVKALLNPVQVNDRLRDTVHCYREVMGI